MNSTQSMLPNGRSSWMSHILGLERLFEVQGPSIFECCTALDNALLESCRSLMIIGAFFTQKPSLMGKPGWKDTMPHRRRDNGLNTMKTSPAMLELSFTMETLAELPTLFLQCDHCLRIARTRPSARLSIEMIVIRTRVNQLQEALQAWKEEWKCNHRNDVFETLPANKVDAAQTPAWKTVFWFSGVETAITFAMYHTVFLLLISIPTSLPRVDLFGIASSDSSSHQAGSSSLSHLYEVQNSVHKICRSIEYHLQYPRPSQAFADFYLFFPIHVARRACVRLQLSQEFEWLANAFEAMKLSYPMGVWSNMDLGDKFSGFQEGMFG